MSDAVNLDGIQNNASVSENASPSPANLATPHRPSSAGRCSASRTGDGSIWGSVEVIDILRNQTHRHNLHRTFIKHDTYDRALASRWFEPGGMRVSPVPPVFQRSDFGIHWFARSKSATRCGRDSRRNPGGRLLIEGIPEIAKNHFVARLDSSNRLRAIHRRILVDRDPRSSGGQHLRRIGRKRRHHQHAARGGSLL